MKDIRRMGFGWGMIFCLLASALTLPAEDGKKPASAPETAGKNAGTNRPPELNTWPEPPAPVRADTDYGDLDDEDIRKFQFLQKNFHRFVPVTFQKDMNAEAVIQYLNYATNKFRYAADNKFYFGFKFTVPEWLDGDFDWMFTLTKTKAQKNFPDGDFEWYILPEKGYAPGFSNYNKTPFDPLPDLKGKFPYSRKLYLQSQPRSRLQPGQTYGIWFKSPTDNYVDVAFAMTIDSPRGEKEFGNLPLH